MPAPLIFSRLLQTVYILFFMLLLSGCSKEGDKYFFSKSDLLGTWVSTRYDTYDGQSHEGLSRFEFRNDDSLIINTTLITSWDLLTISGSAYYTPKLMLGNFEYDILEATRHQMVIVEPEHNNVTEDRIWYFSKE